MKIIYSFLLTLIAGLSTILGYFAIFIKGERKSLISFFLAYSGAIMLFISLVDLIPSSFNYLNNYFLLYRLLIIIGFLILGFLLSNYINESINMENNLKKIGLLSFISIILHNIPEGIITFMTTQINFKLGLILGLAITFHNIPEGISIAIPYYYGSNSKVKAFIMVLIAGLSELLGGIIGYLFLIPYLNNLIMAIILILTSGIMLNIALCNLVKEAYNYSHLKTIWGFIFGIIISLLLNILI